VHSAACRTLAKPYSKHSSADELKLLGIISAFLQTLTAALQPGMPQQLQECTAEVGHAYGSMNLVGMWLLLVVQCYCVCCTSAAKPRTTAYAAAAHHASG
jgi:hypothetical protein